MMSKLQLHRQKSKKLSLKQQRKLIQLFNNLFSSGFTLTEMVNFLKYSQLLTATYTNRMETSLLNGSGLAEMMADLGFSDKVVTQLSLADIHGNTQKSLLKIESYLANVTKVKGKLIEVGTYPVILLTFLILIMLGLKNYLLPQLGEGNIATQIISNFPLLFLGSTAAFMMILMGFWLYIKYLSPIDVASRASRIPFLGKVVQLYLTAYYAREWGNLMGQGVELMQIVQIMQNQKSHLFQEIGKDMELALLSGHTFHEKVLDYPFFLRELSLMIEYGEVKSRLGSELDIYAEETWEVFFSKLTRGTQLVQPFVFVAVALVIVMIYAAMLLPMYQNIGETF